MSELWILYVALSCFFAGYDFASYNIMRKVDNTYPKRNKWFFGYNIYMVWKTSRTVMKD